MKNKERTEQINALPEEPGVYFFKDRAGVIIYIGKATSLRDRVRSYFSGSLHESRSAWIARMRDEIQTVEVQSTDSVLEAVLLEAHLIRKHQPTFNTREKDNKSFIYVVVTRESFPRILMMRERELRTHTHSGSLTVKHAFGPFPSRTVLKKALRIIRKIFPFRDSCVPPDDTRRPKPCFNYQIGLCPGVCLGVVSEDEYAKRIQNIKLFFEGKKGAVIRRLKRDMSSAAQQQDFELARDIRDRISALEHVRETSLLTNDLYTTKDTVAPLRIEGYDVAHTSGTNVVGVMVVVQGGELRKKEYRMFKVREKPGVNDTAALGEIIRRRMGHTEWEMPDVVVVDGGVAQQNAAETALAAISENIPVVAVTKDVRHRPHRYRGDRSLIDRYKEDIVRANMEAHRFALSYHARLRGTF